MSAELSMSRRECVPPNGPGERVASPRYVYPIIGGLTLAFPREMVGMTKDFVRRETVKRVGLLASYAIGLNEAADIGVSARLKLQAGYRQEQFIPLLQTERYLFEELDKRRRVFIEEYPNCRKLVEVAEDDFLFLSENRGQLNPFDFIDVDSGIFEAMYTETVFPKLLQGAGIDFPGDRCGSIADLLNKYSIYIVSSDEPLDLTEGQLRIRRKLRKLHGLEMLMKLDDDIEGEDVDKMLGLPNSWNRIKQKASEPGQSPDDVLKYYRSLYIDMIGRGFLAQAIRRGVLVSFNVSSQIKDAMSCNGIKPTDDLWQFTNTVRRSFRPGCATLRHELEASGLLARAFGD